MDSITQLIKAEIIRQYKSVRRFSEKSGIPYSTLSNALSKGVGGTSYETVVKICNILNLKQAYDADLTVLNDRSYEILAMLQALDEQALHTLRTVLTIEHTRCTSGKKALKVHNKASVAGHALNAHKELMEASV